LCLVAFFFNEAKRKRDIFPLALQNMLHCKKKVSDIPAGNGKIANLFLLCIDFTAFGIIKGFKALHDVMYIDKRKKSLLLWSMDSSEQVSLYHA
jgi:hypothetical protein